MSRHGAGRHGGPSLLVRNLPLDARPEEIRAKFSRYGEIRDVYLPRDYYTQRPKGFGFVEFVDLKDAEDAQYYLNGTKLGGREITVVMSKESRKTPREMLRRERSDRDSSRRRRTRSRSRSPRRRSYSRSRSPRERRRERSYSDGRNDRDHDGSRDRAGGERHDDRRRSRDGDDGRRESAHDDGRDVEEGENGAMARGQEGEVVDDDAGIADRDGDVADNNQHDDGEAGEAAEAGYRSNEHDREVQHEERDFVREKYKDERFSDGEEE